LRRSLGIHGRLSLKSRQSIQIEVKVRAFRPPAAPTTGASKDEGTRFLPNQLRWNNPTGMLRAKFHQFDLWKTLSGTHLAIMVILGSIDIAMGEVDR
jgi:hypothetical protein